MRGLILALFFVMACGDDDDPAPSTCEYEGETHQVGDVFPAEDGCNSCSCLVEDEGGTHVECTLVACELDAGLDATPR